MHALWLLSPLFCSFVAIYGIDKDLIELLISSFIDFCDNLGEIIDLSLHIVNHQLIVETTGLWDCFERSRKFAPLQFLFLKHVANFAFLLI